MPTRKQTQKKNKSSSRKYSRKTLKKNNQKRKGGSRRSKNQRKRARKHRGGQCDYITVQGMNLPGLNLPEQYAKVNSDCQESVQELPTAHPGLSNKA